MSKSSPRVTSRMKKTVRLQREALPDIEGDHGRLGEPTETPHGADSLSEYIVLKSEGEPEFAALQDDADFDLGIFCATPYDGIFLLGEALAQCGDRDTDCIRDFLYATQDREDPLCDTISFDAKGDVAVFISN